MDREKILALVKRVVREAGKAFAALGRLMAHREDDAVGIGAQVRVGALIVFLFFGVFGGWAACAPLESAAVAEGVVSVLSKRKTIQHLEGGIVAQILVTEGQAVEAQQPLVVLDETQPKASLDLVSGRLRALHAVQARLTAERDQLNEIAWPQDLVVRADDPQVAELLASQQSVFKARQEELTSRIALLHQSVSQFEEEVIGLRGMIKSENDQLDLIAEEIGGVQRLVDKGLERKPRLLSLKRQAAEIEGNRSRNTASIARARQSMEESRLKILETQAARAGEVVQELNDVQAKLFDLNEQLGSAADIMRRTVIKAPLAGTVVNLKVHTTGGVIAPGEPLMDIVPKDDRLVVEAKVDPLDIDVVHAGLAARVRITAFSQRTTVPIEGEVIWVSADRLIDANTGQPYYTAQIALTQSPESVLGGASLHPGMAAEVMVITGKRTPLDYLIQPIVQSMNRAMREQ